MTLGFKTALVFSKLEGKVQEEGREEHDQKDEGYFLWYHNSISWYWLVSPTPDQEAGLRAQGSGFSFTFTFRGGHSAFRVFRHARSVFANESSVASLADCHWKSATPEFAFAF